MYHHEPATTYETSVSYFAFAICALTRCKMIKVGSFWVGSPTVLPRSPFAVMLEPRTSSEQQLKAYFSQLAKDSWTPSPSRLANVVFKRDYAEDERRRAEVKHQRKLNQEIERRVHEVVSGIFSRVLARAKSDAKFEKYKKKRAAKRARKASAVTRPNMRSVSHRKTWSHMYDVASWVNVCVKHADNPLAAWAARDPVARGNIIRTRLWVRHPKHAVKKALAMCGWLEGEAYITGRYAVKRKSVRHKVSRKTNTMTAERRKKFAYSSVVPPVPSSGVVLQSGGWADKADEASNRKAMREERDRVQRVAAAAAQRREAKAKPKLERERAVLAERDKRYPVFQAGRVIPLAVGGLLAVTIGKVWKRVSRALDSGTKAADMVSGIVSQLNAVGQTVRKYINKALWKIPIVMALWYVSRVAFPGGPNTTAIFVAVAAAFLGDKIWSDASKFFPGGGMVTDGERIEEQSGGLSSAAELLTVLTAVSTFKRGFSQREIGEFAKRVSMFDRMKGGFEGFISWVLGTLQEVLNMFRSAFGKERVTFVRKAHKEAYAWMKRVEDAYAAHSTATAPLDAEELNKLVGLVRDGSAFKEVYRGTPMCRSIDEMMARAVNLLSPHLGALNARNNFRQEPICAILYGAPGVGKTLLTTAICSTLLVESGVLKEPTFEKAVQNIWQKGTSEYWESYAGQMCVVLDDVFQQRVSVNSTESDFMNLIRMISSWSFPLNMADLASKGKSFFRSVLVVGTTNLASVMSEARIVLQEPGAVTRRITYGYKLILDPKFANNKGMLDHVKFEAEVKACQAHKTGIDRFPWHVWRVAKHDFATGQTSSVEIPLRELVVTMTDDLRGRSLQFANAEANLRNYVNGLVNSEEEPAKVVTPPEVISPSESLMPGLVEIEEQSGLFAAQTPWSTVGAYGKATFRDLRSAFDFEHQTFYGHCRAASSVLWNWFWVCGSAASLVLIASLGTRLIIDALSVTFKLVCRTLGLPRAIFKSLFGRGEEVSVVEESNRPAVVRSNKPTRKLVLDQKKRVDTVEAQGPPTPLAHNAYCNSYKMYQIMGDGTVRTYGQVQFLMSNLAVCPAHFRRNVMATLNSGGVNLDSKLHFVNAWQSQHKWSMSIKGFLGLAHVLREDEDIMFIKFNDVRAHRNIVNNFIRESDIKFLAGKRSASLETCHIDIGGKMLEQPYHYAMQIPALFDYGVLRSSETTVIKRTLRYEIRTEKGDCGAPLILRDASHFSGRAILGFHVAGQVNGQAGFSTILTQEMIAEAEREISIIRDDFEQDLKARGVEMQCGNDNFLVEQGSFLTLGTVPDIPVCPYTSYYKVPSTYGVFGPDGLKPAPLSPVWRDGVQIDPMINALKNYSSPLLIYEQPYLEQAVHLAFQPLVSETRAWSRRIYTFEEAVKGIPQEKFRSIPRKTAAGFPYSYEVRSGKKEFFGDKDEYDLTTERCKELEQRVDYIIDSARKGERKAHVFMDFLKDELRSDAKVEAVATRGISSAPLDYVIAWRRLFGSISTAIMTYHTKIGMAPGICVYTDWDAAARHLQKKGWRVFDGDFKAFDASEQPTIHRLILNAINAWYDDGPANARAREVLWEDMVHSRHVGGLGKTKKVVYQWNKSLPSGHPFTTIVNSFYSLILLIAAYIEITGDQVGFWNEISPLTYGDDNVSNVSERACEVYNQISVAEALAHCFSVTYTPGHKDGHWEPYTTIENITFLKRGFLLRGGVWACPLEISSFLYTCYWCKNHRLEDEIVEDVLELALVELSMHPAEVWDYWAPQIRSVMNERGLTSRLVFKQGAYFAYALTLKDNYY